MEKIINKILSWYSGKNAKNYEKDRKNDKWNFEQRFVEEYIENNLNISSIIDSPIGTNRFGKIIDKCSHIKSLIGIDYSSDMLNFAKSKKTGKLILNKIDIINNKCYFNADLILIIRMLNLFETKISLQILDNLLPAASKYCIATLRYDDSYSIIENKIHIHPLNEFEKKINSHGFDFLIHDFEDERNGNFSIILMVKKNRTLRSL